MAGLTAAWALEPARASGPDRTVTVYQRGWRLGGKGASSRGVHGRIEEHGLHVWLGYYDNAFRVMREVYDELDRPATTRRARSRPGATPSRPPSTSGCADRSGLGAGRRGWRRSPAAQPGDPGDPSAGGPRRLRRTLRRRADAAGRPLGVARSGGSPAGGCLPHRVAPATGAAARSTVALVHRGWATPSARPRWRRLGAALRAGRGRCGGRGPVGCWWPVSSTAGRAPATARLGLDDDAGAACGSSPTWSSPACGAWWPTAWSRGRRRYRGDRRPRLPARGWRRTAPRPRRCESPMVSGMYDLVFAYEDGDPSGRPSRPGSACSSPRSCSSSTRARSSGRCGRDGRRGVRPAVPGAAARAGCGSSSSRASACGSTASPDGRGGAVELARQARPWRARRLRPAGAACRACRASRPAPLAEQLEGDAGSTPSARSDRGRGGR